ncbi:MAG TPA: Rrf2 family transcriptional regulator, partial [Bacteroidetes bacterium]|nr:Rrf2 family transcriptional regulator [Bacteroidota bacterium]
MFSKACRYALRAVLYLAIHSSENQKIGVSAMAESLQVPRHFLAKILQQLTRAGLISSAKGPNGGFYCSVENLKVTLEQVIICIDGKEILTGCIMGLPACSAEKPCPLHHQAIAFREGLNYQLKFQTVGEMALRI